MTVSLQKSGFYQQYNRTRTIAAGGEGGVVLYGFVPVGEKAGSRTQLRTRCGVEVLLDLFGGGGGRSQSNVHYTTQGRLS